MNDTRAPTGPRTADTDDETTRVATKTPAPTTPETIPREAEAIAPLLQVLGLSLQSLSKASRFIYVYIILQSSINIKSVPYENLAIKRKGVACPQTCIPGPTNSCFDHSTACYKLSVVRVRYI